MIASDTTTRVGHLRVGGGGPDTPARRLRLAARVGGADLRPPGLPVSAVLIVRRLVVAGPQAGAQWERAAQAAVAQAAVRASRPQAGHLEGAAEAVLFRDEGELLACLALDIRAGALWERWWWHSYLRGGGHSLTLEGALSEGLPVLPAAMHYLSSWGVAGALVAALAPEACVLLLARLAQRYDAPALAAPLRRAWLSAELATREEAEPTDNQTPLTAPLEVGPSPEPPWAQLLGAGAVPGSLAPAQGALLGVALAVHLRPAAVRGAGFARAFARWWTTATVRAEARSSLATLVGPLAAEPPPALAAPVDAGARGAAVPSPGRPAPAVDLAPAPSSGAGEAPGSAPEPTAAQAADSPELSCGSTALPGAEHSLAPLPTRAPAEAQTQALGREHGLADHASTLPIAAPLAATEPAASPPLADSAPGGSSWLAPEGGLHTGLGGVLFLINLMAHLDLPARLPPGPGRSCGPWGGLELLARGLLADASIWSSDPLWAALAALDGRAPGAPPGHPTVWLRRAPPPRRSYVGHSSGWHSHPCAARACILPAEWREQLEGSATLCWRRRGRWLQLWSDDGLWLYDGPAPPGGPQAALVACLGPTAAAERIMRHDDSGPRRDPASDHSWATPCQRRWLALVLPFVRFRLGQALGLDDPATELDAALLLRPARLQLSATHLDLVMALDTVSIPARRAGLDRDPGWLSDFGRVIKFYFE